MTALVSTSLGGACCKTFVVQRMQTQQSTIIQAQVDLSVQAVDLSAILASHCPAHSHHLLIYDPATNAFLPLRNQEGRVDRSLLDPAFIFLRFTSKQLRPRRGSAREDRSKERTIGEVIDLVREWRALHETRTRPHNHRKKLSLPEAAAMVGVSKKSLDDYYCQLRIAEQHGFDFEKHLTDGVGVLRAFVKNRRQQSHKHPKFLRVIEDLSFLSTQEPPKESSTLQEEREQHIEGEERECVRQAVEVFSASSVGFQNQKLIQDLECEYYRGFEYLLDEPIDPFMNLSRNFSVRFSDDESNNILFY